MTPSRALSRGRGRSLIACSLTIAVGVAALGALGLHAGWLDGLRATVTDAIVFPRGEASPDVIIVAIDARSVTEQGQAWPWTRDRQANLVRAVADAGARVVVLDMVLAPAGLGDDQLAVALGSVRSVIGVGVEVASDRERQWTDAGVLMASNVIEPVAAFAAEAATGHTAVTPEGYDGVTRTLPLVIEWNRRFRPALSLAAFAESRGTGTQVTVRPRAVQVGSTAIPTDDRHRLRISYTEQLSGTDPSTVVSAADVLNGSARERLRDKTVFIGVTDPVSGDRLLTPIAKRSGNPGVLVHANAFNTMVSSTYLRPVTDTETVTWMFVLSLTVALATLAIRLSVGLVTAAVSVMGFLVLAVARGDRGTVVEVLYPLAAMALATFAAAGLRELLVDRQRRQIASLFAQYVPPRVARELVGDERSSGLLNGQHLEATVLFCDIRGFTPLTAPLTAGQIRELLDTYYSVLSRIVLDHGGSVLRYTGDEILAAFGAPLAQPDHAQRAVTCAVAMHQERPALAKQLAASGLPAFGYGIGVQSGDVVSAVMGSDIRRQYAVIGTTLTLGARLCAQAAADEVIASEETWAQLGASVPPAKELVATLKGRDAPVALRRITVTPDSD
jgi:adenylate cyclase